MNAPAHEARLRRTAFSLSVFGSYLLVLAGILMIVPNLVLGVFGIAPTQEPWIRVAGMLAGFLGFYYVRYSPRADRFFFTMTVQARGVVWIFFVSFVLFAGAPWQLVLFGAVDFASAVWTWWALGADARLATASA